MTAGDGARPVAAAEVERRIQHTRVELAATLEALVDKLAARHLVEKGLDMWKDNFNGSDRLQRGLDVIRDNPLPVALIGIGAAWLLADQLIQAEQVATVRRRVGEMIERPLGHTGSALIDETSATGYGWAHQLADRAAGAAASVREWGGTVSGQAGDFATSGANRVAGQLRDAVHRYPLAMGAIAAVAGAAIAMLLPASRTEDDLLGPTRDSFGTRLRETAARAAGAAVDAAAGTLKSELDKQSQP